MAHIHPVVICLKIPTFVVATTTADWILTIIHKL